MTPTREGSIRLFKLWGIDVHIHWSWFIVAMYSVSVRVPNYTSPIWAVGEYLALFVIVLLHEFGHSLACRQVGGQSDQIVLWPLGGVAYVNAPQRPGATLWSIAAGPLVNVVLVPVLYGCWYWVGTVESLAEQPDVQGFAGAVFFTNVLLLVFNLLPVYPLDGGQILRSILWYPLGKGRSLLVATVIGFAGGIALAGYSVWRQSIWMGIMTFFLLTQCWQSFKLAQAQRKVEQLPRRSAFACRSCRSSPPQGNYWLCPSCQQGFDPFATNGTCPQCQTTQTVIPCPDCGEAGGLAAWDATIREV